MNLFKILYYCLCIKKVIKCWTLIQIHIDILNITKKKILVLLLKNQELDKACKNHKIITCTIQNKKKLKQNSE